MPDTVVHTVALPAGFWPVGGRPLFRCGANAGLHRMHRHRVNTAIKEAVGAVVRQTGQQPVTGPVTIRAVQHPAPGARTLDSDNIAPIVKAAIDGLRAAGVLINDSHRYVTETTYAVGDRIPGGQLVLHLTEIRDVIEPEGTNE